MLSHEELRKKLTADKLEDRLVVVPMDTLPESSSLDIRLGTKFILTRHTRQGLIDPLQVTREQLAEAQERIELRFDEEFILHPGRLILASTLEYLAVPNDLAAMVITRSTYGRLGLITATAAFVHPGFKGCLTLELLNLGNMPVVLYPGLGVAQLVFFRADPAQPRQSRYALSTGPEYPLIADTEQEKVRRLRARWTMCS